MSLRALVESLPLGKYLRHRERPIADRSTGVSEIYGWLEQKVGGRVVGYELRRRVAKVRGKAAMKRHKRERRLERECLERLRARALVQGEAE